MPNRSVPNFVLIAAFFLLLAIGLGLGRNSSSVSKNEPYAHVPVTVDYVPGEIAENVEQSATADTVSVSETYEQENSYENISESSMPVDDNSNEEKKVVIDDEKLLLKNSSLENAAVKKAIIPAAGTRESSAEALLDLMLACGVRPPGNTPPSLRELLGLATQAYEQGHYDRAFRLSSVAIEVLNSLKAENHASYSGSNEESEDEIEGEAGFTDRTGLFGKHSSDEQIPDSGISSYQGVKINDKKQESDLISLSRDMTYNGYYYDGVGMVALLRKMVGEGRITLRVKQNEEVPGIPGLKVVTIEPQEIVLSGPGGRPFIRIARSTSGGAKKTSTENDLNEGQAPLGSE